jgi:hypothetical protein
MSALQQQAQQQTQQPQTQQCYVSCQGGSSVKVDNEADE